MEIIIESLYRSDEGIYFTGSIPRPERGHVPNLGDMNSGSENERGERLEQWTEDSKEVNRIYSAEMAEYTKAHLGQATLIQEDVEE